MRAQPCRSQVDFGASRDLLSHQRPATSWPWRITRWCRCAGVSAVVCGDSGLAPGAERTARRRMSWDIHGAERWETLVKKCTYTLSLYQLQYCVCKQTVQSGSPIRVKLISLFVTWRSGVSHCTRYYLADPEHVSQVRYGTWTGRRYQRMQRHPSELKCVFLFSCRWGVATHTNKAETTWLDDWLPGKQPLFCAIKAQRSLSLLRWGNAGSREAKHAE